MAKKKKQDEERTVARPAGPSIVASASALPTMKVSGPRPGFRYTSPSAIPPRSAADRREHGCEATTYTRNGKEVKKFTGRLDEKHGGLPDTFCKPTSKPCGERSSCPVQLVWLGGKPALRFCVTPGSPGHVVGVRSAREAQVLAEEACRDWPFAKKKVRWPRKYFEKKTPAIVARARRERPASPWGQPGLGESSRAGKGGHASTAGVFAGSLLAGFLVNLMTRDPP